MNLQTHFRKTAILRALSAGTAAIVILAAPIKAASAVLSGSFYDTCPLPPAVEAELLMPAFTDTLYKGPLKHAEVASIDDLTDHILEMFMPAELFRDAYDQITIVDSGYECLDAPECAYHVLSVTYTIGGLQYTAHAYHGEAVSGPSEYAAVIIPGSGHNQATAIYFNDYTNYHYDIAALVQKDWDMYVCVKPNEDFLAIHNGEKKLNYEYIVTFLANLGGSYSSRYIVDTMAIVKHLKTAYTKTAVIGLSQGGQATLYNSLQSYPDGAFVASGFSVIQERLTRNGLAQILIPGIMEFLSNDDIFEGIQSSSTKYVFSWGKSEAGLYGVDADLGCTKTFLAPLKNVTSVTHGLGHVFPGLAVTDFLRSIASTLPEPGAHTVLRQNVPNPFSSATQIAFSLVNEGRVRLEIFDASGRLVNRLVDEDRGPETYIEEWDGKDGSGRPVPSGIYFYRLQAPDWDGTKKMTLVK